MSSGIVRYQLSDVTGEKYYNMRIMLLRFLRDFPENNEILMIDMTDDYSNVYVNLPTPFLGPKLVAPTQTLSYDMILVATPKNDFVVRTEAIFEVEILFIQGNRHSCDISYDVRVEVVYK